VSEGTNRNMPARNTLVQLLAAYTNPERQNAQRLRRTDRQQDDVKSRSYCVAVRSAKNWISPIQHFPLQSNSMNWKSVESWWVADADLRANFQRFLGIFLRVS